MTSKAYWAARAAALEYHIQSGAVKPIKEIARLYRTASEQVQREINKIRRTLEKRGDLSPEAWDAMLSRADADVSYRELRTMLRDAEDPAVITNILNRMDAQAYGARITRLESVKNKIFHEFTKAAVAEKGICDLFFGDVLQEAYYTDVYNLAEGYNCGVAFDVLPKRAIRQALQEPWQGSNYSDRIWAHSQEFIQQVETTVTSGLLSGVSVPKMAAQMRAFTDKANYVTERLVRTETAHFMALGQKDAYEAVGMNRYRFLAALSERTCEVCGGLDSRVFYLADAREGHNYPPIHPNCRCTTIPADTELGSRRAYDPETGKSYLTGDVSFQEWKDGLTGEQKEALTTYAKATVPEKKIVDKPAGSVVQSVSSVVQDVTKEYLDSAKPGQGNILFDDGYKVGKHREEIKTAEWLRNTFGGDVKLLKEAQNKGIKTPDSIWREKFWEYKSAHSINAVDKRLQDAIKQIQKNPGGVVLDIVEEIPVADVERQLLNRFMRNGYVANIDVILRNKQEFIKILRYKK